MAAAVPRIQELHAPATWRTAEFISDLHLQAGEPGTFEAWRRYLRDCSADALFILGDLFEVWVGDDAAEGPGFAADCAAVLRAAASARPVFFMHGNRDFLVGPDLMRACGATLLHDPTVLAFAGRRWLLTHGDALCLSDTDYQQFRAIVRAPGWQQAFLARPLGERQAVARDLRGQSEARKQTGVDYGDVDSGAATQWLEAADAGTMIHGHTHRPADHLLPGGHQRIVLSDWDAAATPTRLQTLRIDAAGAHRIALA
ncbi:MAG: UDP-2,3-diacylglucosamine diphosphatase [Comamonadaceae bacterium]|nr:MAG: UDP-2,3-diacylglucosamine diphosphatase [Comamonadaceae bacterium]